jgi:mono/diheme cytochrome c family protein
MLLNNLLSDLERKEILVKLFVLAPVVLLLALPGCTAAPSEVPVDPSYATDVQPIFNGNCLTCHGTASPSGSYSLNSRAGALGNGSDTVPNVIPNNSDSSKLYRRIIGTETPQMPPGQAPLDTVETATVRNWIDKGAKEN